VLAVHASANCQRFVRTYIAKPVRNRVSETTADAWTKWRVTHPDWKPNPKLHRPKYVMTHDEAVRKVDFACSIPIIPSTIGMRFIPTDFEGPPPNINLPPMETTLVLFPDEIPPDVAEITPAGTWPPLGPFVPPILGTPPPVAGEAAEPASLLLASTGIGFLYLLLGTKLRRAATEMFQGNSAQVPAPVIAADSTSARGRTSIASHRPAS
jgi:hypothetical protein